MSSFRVINDMLVPQDETVHGPFTPSRISQYDRITCSLNAAPEIPRQLWSISPFGIELVMRADEKFEVGQPMALRINLHDQALMYQGIVVASGYLQSGMTLVGIRAQPQARAEQDATSVMPEQRSHLRWACSPLFYPTGITHNPAKFEDPILFRVRDLSAGGMLFSTSMRNKHLVKGLKLKAIITCPTIGDTTVTFIIQHLHVEKTSSASYQIVGAKFESLSKHARQQFGQYILQFATHPEQTPSLNTLSKQGFSNTSLRAPVALDLVKTPEQYQKVLKLRHQAAEQQSAVENPNTFDLQDVRAHILLGSYRQDAIVSARLALHDAQTNLEHEQHLHMARLLPDRHHIAELTRICVHPDFNVADTHLRLISYAAIFALQSKRRYLLLSIPQTQLKIYKKFGFKSLKVEFKAHTQDTKGQLLGLIDLHRPRQTKLLHPSVYDATISDLGHITQSIDASQLRMGTKVSLYLHKLWRLVHK